jgi:hypothetical protein
MEKFQTQKLKRAEVLKKCGHSLGTTFGLSFFKILSADGRASASNVEKKLKIVQIFQHLPKQLGS